MYTSVVVNDGCVAQLVEHLTFNQRVWSSNLQRGTRLKLTHNIKCCEFFIDNKYGLLSLM